MSTKVYVGDLGPNGNKQELEKEFERFGALKSVWVARNPPGFAFVEFEDPHDAEDAIRELDGKTVGNVRIRVEFAKNRHSGGGGGGGGGGGYQGRSRRPPPPGRGYYDRRGSPPRRRSRSPFRRDSRSRSPWRRKSNYNRSPYYNRRSHSKSPYYDRRRSRSPPYRRSPGPRDDRRMDNSRSPSPR